MNFAQFFQEDNGNLSSTRLAFVLWTAGVLAVWIITSLKSGQMQMVPDSVAAVIGIFMTGKLVQKFGEKPPV